MLVSRLVFGIACTMSITLVAGSTSDDEIHNTHGLRRTPGLSDTETMTLLGRAMEMVALERRTQVIKNSTSISKSWQDAILLYRQTSYVLSFFFILPIAYYCKSPLPVTDPTQSSLLGNSPLDANVTIMCKSCYATAKLTTSLTFSDRFDATKGIEDVTNGVQPITKTMTQNVVNFIQSTFQNSSTAVMPDIQNVADGNLGLEMLPYPTLPFDFNPAIASIQDITVQHQIDGMELYAQLETSLSKGATYEMNLFTSKSMTPLRISDSLSLGVSADVDLIIDARSAMDMTNGFHIRFNDGLLMEMKLFANTPPHVTL